MVQSEMCHQKDLVYDGGFAPLALRIIGVRVDKRGRICYYCQLIRVIKLYGHA